MPPTQRNRIYPQWRKQTENPALPCRGRQEMVWQWLVGTPQIGPDFLFEADPFRRNSKCILQTERFPPPRDNFNKLLEWRKKKKNDIGSYVREPRRCHIWVWAAFITLLPLQIMVSTSPWELHQVVILRVETFRKLLLSLKPQKNCFTKRHPPQGYGNLPALMFRRESHFHWCAPQLADSTSSRRWQTDYSSSACSMERPWSSPLSCLPLITPPGGGEPIDTKKETDWISERADWSEEIHSSAPSIADLLYKPLEPQGFAWAETVYDGMGSDQHGNEWRGTPGAHASQSLTQAVSLI